jgi:hypothetical protein
MEIVLGEIRVRVGPVLTRVRCGGSSRSSRSRRAELSPPTSEGPLTTDVTDAQGPAR